MSNINNRIQHVRKSLNMTQKAFSKKLGIGQSTIASIENGTNNPSKQLIHNISREFNITVNWIKTGKEPIKKSNEKILEEAINKIGEYTAAEKAFLNMLEKQIDEMKDKESNFYNLLIKLKTIYENADRDTQGYLKIQLKKTFSDYL